MDLINEAVKIVILVLLEDLSTLKCLEDIRCLEERLYSCIHDVVMHKKSQMLIFIYF